MRRLLHPKLYRRPELLFHPLRALRRLAWCFSKPKGAKTVTLPWGLAVTVSPDDTIGQAILKTGAYDTAVLECLARLIEPGETCLDIGANFGLMTGLMARAAAPDGKVMAFEPHPELRSRLEAHVDGWRASGTSLGEIEISPHAASDQAGHASLEMTAEFEHNQGSARLASNPAQPEGSYIEVETVRVDEVVGDRQIGVLKIDVEGHEKAALEGAAGLLEKRAVRDIIYEDHDGYPSPVSDLLENHGYRVYLIRKGLRRPLLLPPETPRYELPNFLATLNPPRAERAMMKVGYRVL